MSEILLGQGLDLVECQRISDCLEKFGDRFLDRIFLPSERSYAGGHAQPAPHYAARFAAKEAVSKALGTGIGQDLGWKDIEVVREASGQPRIQLHGAGLKLFQNKKGLRISLSLTHTKQYAVASALLIGSS
ncbi:MAG: holo-ACP synthase [Blastochloris sp.]|mgnify:CR=1 FL=1|jgi:holo-[acyl-carrier protein] synthase|nr:holo-ACP synthase [Blastochloris sp.]